MEQTAFVLAMLSDLLEGLQLIRQTASASMEPLHAESAFAASQWLQTKAGSWPKVGS